MRSAICCYDCEFLDEFSDLWLEPFFDEDPAIHGLSSLQKLRCWLSFLLV